MLGIASRYCDEREVSADYRQALRRVALSMATAGIDPSTVSDSSFNEWLGNLHGSPTTRSNYRRMGLTLWRAAIEAGLATQSIGRVKRVKAPLPPPVAWTHDELRDLLRHVDTLRGEFSSGCSRRAFWRAWVLAGYESGIRFGDLHGLRSTAIRGRRLIVVQNKTGRPLGKVLSEDCVASLQEMAARSPDGSVFRWALSRRWVIVHFARVVRDAGLVGSTKTLRRSGATHVEIAHPGSASRFLGHLSPGLAQRHYLDPSIVALSAPSPPPIVYSK